MLVPRSWLHDYCNPGLSTDALADRLSFAGLEVDAVHRVGDWWEPDKVVVARLLSVEQHPDADKLVVCRADVGHGNVVQIVTGAPNIFVLRDRGIEGSRDQGALPPTYVVVALPGGQMVDAYADTPKRAKVKAGKLRGVESAGVLCSEKELGISEEHEGVIVLPPGTAEPGTPAVRVLGDDILEIAITPDVAHCLSVVGVAREVSVLSQQPFTFPDCAVDRTGTTPTSDLVSVSIEDAKLCPRYIASVVRGVKVAPAPAWMQARVTAGGVRPISNLVDVTNYVLLELGQPLHAFDLNKLLARSSAGKVHITVRAAKSGETITTIDHVERKLDAGDIVIADERGPVALAGVMGGADTEIDETTTDVLLESATFHNVSVRRTSQRFRLSSESSYRYARGVPEGLCAPAGARALKLFLQTAGGQVLPDAVDCHPAPRPPRHVYLSASELERQIGIPVSLEQAAGVLNRLEVQTEHLPALPADAAEKNPDGTLGLHTLPGEPVLACRSPWYRLDINHPADLTEEVARVIGFDAVPSRRLADELPPPFTDALQELETAARSYCLQAGLSEAVAYSLTTRAAHEKLALAEAGAPYVALQNVLMSHREVLRRSMRVSMVETLSYNTRFSQRQAAFELGRVYLPECGDGTLPAEERRLCIGLTGPRQARHFAEAADAGAFDFFDLKGLVEGLLARLGVPAEMAAFEKAGGGFYSDRAATLKLADDVAGTLGELSPQLRAGLEQPIERPVFVAELHLGVLLKHAQQQSPPVTVNRLQPVVEDMAFVVDEATPAATIQRLIRQAGGGSLEAVEMFDVFRGESLGTGKKSLAYRLSYQGQDKALTEKDVGKLRDKIARSVERQAGGTVRGA